MGGRNDPFDDNQSLDRVAAKPHRSILATAVADAIATSHEAAAPQR